AAASPPEQRDEAEQSSSPSSATPTGHASPTTAGLDPDYGRLLDSMGQDPVAPDELVARTGFSAQAVSSMLLLLELQGHVSCLAGGRYCRQPG
ncbi:MAG: hypothetical protein ACLFNA_11075, partial [Halochromatium sp.]